VGGERPLTSGEIELASSIFGTAIDYCIVRIRRRKWFAFQPRHVTMAPNGHLYFHPNSRSYCEDFSRARLQRKSHFIHEMAHVWQFQRYGKWFLIFKRMPLARYHYTLKPGWPLARYGVEQQAEIIKHAFLLRSGVKLAGVADAGVYDVLVSFPGATM